MRLYNSARSLVNGEANTVDQRSPLSQADFAPPFVQQRLRPLNDPKLKVTAFSGQIRLNTMGREENRTAIPGAAMAGNPDVKAHVLPVIRQPELN